MHLFGDAEDSFLKFQRKIFAQIGAALRAGAPAAALSEGVAETEEVAEDVMEVVEDGGIEAAKALTRSAAYAGMAEAIVARALFGVGEDGIGLAAFLEALFGFGIIGIAVGMKLQRELAVRALDLLVAGSAGDAKDLVVIAFYSSGQK